MTRDDIIRLAVEAKLVCHWDGGCASAWVEGHDLTPYLERFAALVAAAEREACANVCEILAWNQDSTRKAATMDCAAAIRARGQE
jgi:hypothetical protein